MSRSGYSDDCDDQWSHIMWRGAVSSAIRGKRGQAFLKRAATINECVKAALSVRYGSPSSRLDQNPSGWHLDRDCTPTDAGMHDNGCVDAAKAIRALASEVKKP